jgi:thymidine kinase
MRTKPVVVNMIDELNRGRIEVISGCMFAGKTEELLRRLRRAEVAGKSVEVFSPSMDGRYGEDVIGSHNGKSWSATVLEVSEKGQERLLDADSFDVVAVDEFNFFDSSFIHTLNCLADSGTRVIVSGTDQTFRGEPFEPVHELMAVADDVEKLTAICECCGSRATRNQRMIDGEPASVDSPTVQVGGEESYQARCRHCHELSDSNKN